MILAWGICYYRPQMDDSFASLIDSSASILILLPTKPFFDQVAAGLGLFLSLHDRKETQISCPSELTVEFHRLIGVNKIISELGNKDLTIKFVDYNPQDIERVSADIENNEFKLMVIPKPGMVSPKKEQVELSFSGVSADMVILIGGANESHFPQLSSNDLAAAKIIHVGTRELALSAGKGVISFAKPGSSISEVVATIISKSEFPMDVDIATNLASGIEEGSKSFGGPEVTAETFEVFAELLKKGARRISKEKVERAAYPVGSIPGEEPQAQAVKAPSSKAPKDWLEPKIYKGTTVS